MDYCVMCGEMVPEGTHICLNCRRAVLAKPPEETAGGVVREEKGGYNGTRSKRQERTPWRYIKDAPFQRREERKKR